MGFYILVEDEERAREIIKALPPERQPEKWFDGSYCRQVECDLVWPNERHGREGREMPALRLFAEPCRTIWEDGSAPRCVRLVMDAITGGWTREQYPIPPEWKEALRGLRHLETRY